MPQYRVIPFSEVLRPRWDAFVDAHPEAWWWHRSEWLAYCLAYHPGARDLSFAVLLRDQIVGLCPVIVEGDEIAMGGEPGAAFVVPPGQGRAGVEADLIIRDEIDRLAAEHGIRRVAFRWTPQPEPPAIGGLDHRWWPEWLENRGYRDISWTTRVLDLTQPEASLWRGLRKGHRADIRKAEREYRLTVGGDELFMVYEQVHRSAHGNPRPDATYTLMRRWCADGVGLVVKAADIAAVASAYFLVYKDGAYYASAAALVPDVMAAVVWQAILALKARGVRTLELGWCARKDDSEKACNVAHFKAGFCSTIAPLYAVEKLFPTGGLHAD